MAIGHNFGCETYRKNLEPPGPGREDIDGKGTWCKLDELLRKAGASPANCYRTNWFIGLLPGKKNNGPFLLKPDSDYEGSCRSLLRKQIIFLRPKTILFLGPEVIRRAYQIFPALEFWRNARKFMDVDQSSIGHSLRNIEIQDASSQTNLAALLHPSFGASNQGRRMKNMSKPMTEVEIIRAVLTVEGRLPQNSLS
jgi:uracil-DNA glycosylase